MDVLFPLAVSILAAIGAVAAIAGVESRDGFDRDGRLDPISPLDTRLD
jgi:hypothetical protein